MHQTYWQSVWHRFKKHRLGVISLFVIVLFCLVGVYAPLFASSKPIFVKWNGVSYFPLLKYLFYPGFYTKRLDIFFNLLMFTLPLLIIGLLWLKRARFYVVAAFVFLQCGAFFYCISGNVRDPASDARLNIEKQSVIQEEIKKGSLLPSWDFDLKYMNDYAKLNLIVNYTILKRQNDALKKYQEAYTKTVEKRWSKRNEKALSPEEKKEKFEMPTLWNINQMTAREEKARQKRVMETKPIDSLAYRVAEAKYRYVVEKQEWLKKESESLQGLVMPLVTNFHWEDDAGGGQTLNQFVSLMDLTRINRKDLTAALIFGIRISLVVGITAVVIALWIGIPIGSLAGYYGGKFDIITCRLLEIWESMPTFFMLLLVVAMLQSKSIFLVISVIGLFGWTSFSRYIRGEFFKQRNLSYVEACRALGFNDKRIIFLHILPNAIPPILTLIPFAMMAAITSEAGLSFLGLGEEGSTSWGVLMDEGRTAFPAESYLLWPPAALLVILLVAIALVGDAMRDTLDPKMKI